MAREFGTAIETQIGSFNGIETRQLAWVVAKDRATGLPAPTGLWNGEGAREFVIDGETRTYQGAGALLDVGNIRGETGLNVQMHEINLSSIPAVITQLIRDYNPRLAPIEVHTIVFDPVKGVPIGDPIRILKGKINAMPVPTPADGGGEVISMSVATAARDLTQTVDEYKSDGMQRRIDPNDRGREYSNITVRVPWGVKSSRGAPAGSAS